MESCFEKEDLINLIESRKRPTPDETYVFVERRDGRFTEASNNNTTRINTSIQPEVQEPTANSNEEVNRICFFLESSSGDWVRFYLLFSFLKDKLTDA